MADYIDEAEKYIMPLNMNGLQGRMLHAPSTKDRKREILLLYGHHAMLERWWGLVENLQEYGNVTMPDLPGFGGMESFYKIGQQPTIDNFADYLAAFVRLRYKRRRVTIIGISFGFVVATRMLQRYPELAKKVDILVSLVGFMHRDDFLFKPFTRKCFRVLSRFFGTRPVSYIIRYAALNASIIRFIYTRLPNGKRRLSTMDPIETKAMLAYDVKLWQLNDVSTHWRTTCEFFGVDNCAVKINLPVWHVASTNDHYFDTHFVEQHMLVVFTACYLATIDAKAHTPSILGDKKEMGTMLPLPLRKALARNP
jgi:pimeloyl-ACP methyl ester carboxylesterase